MHGVEYRRDLPHKFPTGTPIFVTWRLYGSLPDATPDESARIEKLTARQKFTRIERLLDAATFGPLWLSDPNIAEMVCATIERGHTQFRRYSLHAYVVMSNHVHLLITPRFEMSFIMKELKGVTARRANLLLGRTGQTFWRAESFDRWCRDVEHFEKIRNYIALNPVKVGAAVSAEAFPWSSSHRNVCAPLGK
jgi:putative transposase